MKTHFFVATIFAGLILYTSAPAVTGQQQDALPKPGQVLQNGVSQNNYLAPLLTLRSHGAEYLASPLRAEYLEMMTLACSYVGEQQAAYGYEEMFLSDLDVRNKSRERNRKDVTSAPFDAYKPVSALKAIGARAAKHQVVMINEEHRTPHHRALTLQLLPRLRAQGYRYFAAETLHQSDADLNRRGYPTQKTGYYTADPVYADAVRAALRLGFKVVAYEYDKPCTPKPDSPMSCQDERERGQAQNLVDRILKDDPQAKILVHVGRSHNAKVKFEGQFAFMGWHFRDISKITPYVIDQVRMSERRSRLDEVPLYRYAAQKWPMEEPTVFQAANGDLWTDNPQVADVRVFQPREQYHNGRPTWLQAGNLRKSQAIDLRKLNLQAERGQFAGQEPVLIQAFAASEGADAVPLDQVVLYPQKPVPPLVLSPGTVRLRAVDKTGKTVGQYAHRVK